MDSMSQLPEQQGEVQAVFPSLGINDSELPASDNPLSPTASSEPVICSPSEALQLFSETYGKYMHGELALGMCVVGIITNVANLMVCTRTRLCELGFVNLKPATRLYNTCAVYRCSRGATCAARPPTASWRRSRRPTCSRRPCACPSTCTSTWRATRRSRR